MAFLELMVLNSIVQCTFQFWQVVLHFLVTPKKNNEANDIKAVQLLTETNLGLFAQSSFSAQNDVNYLDRLLCDGRRAPGM